MTFQNKRGLMFGWVQVETEVGGAYFDPDGRVSRIKGKERYWVIELLSVNKSHKSNYTSV